MGADKEVAFAKECGMRVIHGVEELE